MKRGNLFLVLISVLLISGCNIQLSKLNNPTFIENTQCGQIYSGKCMPISNNQDELDDYMILGQEGDFGCEGGDGDNEINQVAHSPRSRDNINTRLNNFRKYNLNFKVYKSRLVETIIGEYCHIPLDNYYFTGEFQESTQGRPAHSCYNMYSNPYQAGHRWLHSVYLSYSDALNGDVEPIDDFCCENPAAQYNGIGLENTGRCWEGPPQCENEEDDNYNELVDDEDMFCGGVTRDYNACEIMFGDYSFSLFRGSAECKSICNEGDYSIESDFGALPEVCDDLGNCHDYDQHDGPGLSSLDLCGTNGLSCCVGEGDPVYNLKSLYLCDLAEPNNWGGCFLDDIYYCDPAGGCFYGGVNSIGGCTDDNACNYLPIADFDDGSCAYVVDCAGECGGYLEVDECGVCGGEGIPHNCGVDSNHRCCNCNGDYWVDCKGRCCGGNYRAETSCGPNEVCCIDEITLASTCHIGQACMISNPYGQGCCEGAVPNPGGCGGASCSGEQGGWNYGESPSCYYTWSPPEQNCNIPPASECVGDSSEECSECTYYYCDESLGEHEVNLLWEGEELLGYDEWAFVHTGYPNEDYSIEVTWKDINHWTGTWYTLSEIYDHHPPHGYCLPDGDYTIELCEDYGDTWRGGRYMVFTDREGNEIDRFTKDTDCGEVCCDYTLTINL